MDMHAIWSAIAFGEELPSLSQASTSDTVITKAKRPEEWPLDTLNRQVWMFREVKDVHIDLFGYPCTIVDKLPRAAFSDDAGQRTLVFYIP